VATRSTAARVLWQSGSMKRIAFPQVGGEPGGVSPGLTKFACLSIGAAVTTIALKSEAYLLTGSVGLLSDAAESLVNLVAAGEHPDWDEYKQAMADQGKSLIRITPTSWGPVATGGFPPEVAERMG
jgi:hypothetical protein